jgi:hypothetical protein
MTTFTQREQIVFIMGAAVCQWNYVVYLLRRRQPSLSLALLTQRMLQQKTRTDLLPRAAVTFVGVRVTKVLVILTLSNPPVLVAEPTVCQPSAARVGARLLRFVWHPVPPGHEKGPSRFAKALDPSLAIVLSHR